MDPVLEFLNRRHDHSLDGLPVTWILAAMLGVPLSMMVLAMTGRSGRKLAPLGIAVVLWWSGVLFGHGQPGSGSRILALFLLVLSLGLGWQTVRGGAFQPAGKGPMT